MSEPAKILCWASLLLASFGHLLHSQEDPPANAKNPAAATPLTPEELEDLQTTVRYLDLLDEEKALKSQIKEAHAALDLLAYEAYPQLGSAAIKALVVDNLDYLYSRRDGLCLAETHWTHPTAG